MRRSALLIAGSTLLIGISLGEPPATRPQDAGEAALAGLIRDLDDPQFRKREAAARAIVALGPGVLAPLERAAESASFETQASLQDIIHTLRELLRGAIVYRVTVGSPAATAGIVPGDVIVRVHDQPVTSCDHFFELISEDSGDPCTMVIRSQAELREIRIVPRRLGVWLADYQESFGPPLIQALRDFEAKRMAGARDGFAQARAAGLKLTDRDLLWPISALAAYWSGDPAGARKLLEDWSGTLPPREAWELLETILPMFDHECTHLQLFVSGRRLQIEPETPHLGFDHARRLCELNRYPDGVAGLLGLLQVGGRDAPDFSAASAWHTLISAADTLDLEPEGLAGIDRLMQTELRPAFWGRAAEVAERFRRFDRAGMLMGTVADGGRRAGRFDAEATVQAVRLALLAGHADQALALVGELKPAQNAQVLAKLTPTAFRWEAARTTLSALARSSLEYPGPDSAALANAYLALSRVEAPDPAELRMLFHRWAAARRHRGESAPSLAAESLNLAFIALMKGATGEAQRLADSLSHEETATPNPGVDALRWVCAHEARLAGPVAAWRGTRFAWRLPEGAWLLLTRDDRLGIATDEPLTIRDLSPPEPRWNPPPDWPAVLLTARDQRVLTLSGDSLFALKRDRGGWELIARLPKGYGRSLFRLGPALDALVPALRPVGHGPAEVVWPPAIPEEVPRILSLMLADGIWLACDTDEKKVWRPRKDAEAALNVPAEIYAVWPLAGELQPAYLFTSQGLLEWTARAGTVRRVPLSDVERARAVVPSNEGITLDEGRLRLALLPADGGDTFILDTTTGQVQREGCINELIPATYWKQRPAGAKRRLIEQALAEARLKIRWASTQPAARSP